MFPIEAEADLEHQVLNRCALYMYDCKWILEIISFFGERYVAFHLLWMQFFSSFSFIFVLYDHINFSVKVIVGKNVFKISNVLIKKSLKFSNILIY